MALNIVPEAPVDGILYASATPLTITEAVLGNQDTPDPVPVTYGQEIVAIVKLNMNGYIVAHTTYIVMQTDFGDGTWIDVAWVVSNVVQGNPVYVICGGGRGAMNNAFQQSRQAGSAPQPQANGSNAVPLGGRVRFVGKMVTGGGSSFAPGTGAPTVTITYKLSAPR